MFLDEQSVEHDHQLHESGVFRDVMGKALRGSDFVDIIEETFLLFLVERKLMGKGGTAVGETEAQICLFGGNLLHEIRRHRQDDTLVDGVVDLGQLVTFVLVDDKEIPRGQSYRNNCRSETVCRRRWNSRSRSSHGCACPWLFLLYISGQWQKSRRFYSYLWLFYRR